MGPLSLSPSQLSGTLNQIHLSGSFSLNNSRHMLFCPEWIEDELDGMIPNVQSTYGTLLKATVGPIIIQNVPMAFTTYPIKIGLSLLKWAMISALSFQGTDFQVEMVATNFVEELWVSSVYVHYKGEDYYLNEPMFFESSLTHHGEEQNGKRLFGLKIHSWYISADVECSAPTNQFALLDKEGYTQILTTVLGSCFVTIEGNTFNSTPTALLEVKQSIQ